MARALALTVSLTLCAFSSVAGADFHLTNVIGDLDADDSLVLTLLRDARRSHFRTNPRTPDAIGIRYLSGEEFEICLPCLAFPRHNGVVLYFDRLGNTYSDGALTDHAATCPRN